MKLSDYVAQALVDRGVRDVFLVAGGGIMHLLDSVGRHPQLNYYPTLHEQAAVVAAEGYARRTGRVGVALVTVGPGAANAAAGLPGAWTESLPIIVLAGQVRRDIIADYRVQRQFGPQEANTLDMARPVSKYAARVSEPESVERQINTAFTAALSGRPGPAWLEFPLDIQGAEIDPKLLELPASPAVVEPQDLRRDARKVVEELRNAARPVLIPGNGIRMAGAEEEFRALLERTSIPIVVPFSAKDLIEEEHPNNFGVIGTSGQRRANFVLQSSTALFALAAGLNIQKIGFNVQGFAPKAKRIVVDIDHDQLNNSVLKPDVGVLADARCFLRAMLDEIGDDFIETNEQWLAACKTWRTDYPPMTPDYLAETKFVNSYVFYDSLSEVLTPTDTITTGNGLDVVSCFQAFRVRKGQRLLLSAWGSMGWDLPLAIGACIGNGKKRTILVTGDGSINWNLQELGTISQNHLPIKIFIFNNGGYASIRATQNNFFEGRLVGADDRSGVGKPDFSLLAAAYGLPYVAIKTNAELLDKFSIVLADDQPLICEVSISPDQVISPKASSFRRPDGTFESRPLEDMAPFLPREELFRNMHLFHDP